MKRNAVLWIPMSVLLLLTFPQVSRADQTLVIRSREAACVMFDGDGNLATGVGARIAVLTDSATNIEVSRCEIKVENESGVATRYDLLNNPSGRPLRCAYVTDSIIRVTDTWREIVSADGNAVLFCTYREDAEPAVAVDAADCTLFDGDGFLVAAEAGTIRVTPSDTNSMECISNSLNNSTGRAVVYNSDNNPIAPGLSCFMNYQGQSILTMDWHETVTPKGRGRILCRINDAQEH